MLFHHDCHTVLQEARLFLADEINVQRHLFVGFVVHEGEAVAFGIKILAFALFQRRAFDLFRRTEAFVQLGSITRNEKATLIKGLYVIIDPRVTGERDPLMIAQASIRGGASMLQLRDKFRDKSETLTLSFELQKLCASSGVSLIINDHVDIEAIVDSAGVHVGQTDVPVNQARLVLAPDQVLGRSNRDLEQLIESERMGADHVAFGAIFETNTTGKSLGRAPRGVEQLRIAKNNAQTPLVAIGGINADNIATVVEAGADAVCLTAAVALSPEPEAAVANLVGIIEKAGGRI